MAVLPLRRAVHGPRGSASALRRDAHGRCIVPGAARRAGRSPTRTRRREPVDGRCSETGCRADRERATGSHAGVVGTTVRHTGPARRGTGSTRWKAARWPPRNGFRSPPPAPATEANDRADASAVVTVCQGVRQRFVTNLPQSCPNCRAKIERLTRVLLNMRDLPRCAALATPPPAAPARLRRRRIYRKSSVRPRAGIDSPMHSLCYLHGCQRPSPAAPDCQHCGGHPGGVDGRGTPCPACGSPGLHRSDCPVNNGPALPGRAVQLQAPARACDGEAVTPSLPLRSALPCVKRHARQEPEGAGQTHRRVAAVPVRHPQRSARAEREAIAFLGLTREVRYVRDADQPSASQSKDTL